MKAPLPLAIRIVLLVAIPGAFLALSMGVRPGSGQERSTAETGSPSPPTSFTARIGFGYGASEASVWSGTFSVQGGELSSAEGWLLGNEDRVSAGGFTLTPFDTYFHKPQEKGVLLGGTGSGSSALSFATNHGSFRVALRDLTPFRTLSFLDGKVQVRGLTGLTKLSGDDREDDYPSVAVRGKAAWVAWQSYSGRSDQIHLRKYDGSWGTFTPVPGVSGDIWRPRISLDGSGKLWVVWSQQVGGNFDLYARALDETKQEWGNLIRLTSDPGPDLDHQLVADGHGGLVLVWQGFRDGNSDIFLSRFDGESWSPPERVTDHAANDWQPAAAVDNRGGIHVVWDTYRSGNYDVYLRSWNGRRWGPEVPVAATPLFEAHASIAVDAQERLWVAWDEAAPQWGKDSGLTTDPEWRRKGRAAWDAWIDEPSRPGTRLYEYRRINLVIVDGTARKVPSASLQEALSLAGINHHDYPQLILDPASQRIALLFHAWRPMVPTERLGYRRPSWESTVIFYEGSGWSAPCILPRSSGRPSMIPAGAFGGDGDLWLAWPTDGRYRNRSLDGLSGDIHALRLAPPGGSVSAPELREAPTPRIVELEAVHPQESLDVATIRSHRTRIHGKEFRILRGDLHRHTEFSADSRGNLDGSLIDFYRYMMDAASMDFGAVTDHNAGGEYEYAWWLIQKSCDLYQIPESFITLYGYERSLGFPFGHRNVLHARRGVPVTPFFTLPDLQGGRPRVGLGSKGVLEDDTRLLYEELRLSGGISIPHTTASNMGTDWSDNDPDVEPVVEIFQGDRMSYERPGGPKAPRGPEDEPPVGGYQSAGFVSEAYRKGYRLGTIASSDHWSTHISYAMVFAEAVTRQAVFDGIKKRHTYGATDNIILEYAMGDCFMGEECEVSHLPAINVHVIGTSDLTSVEVVKDDVVVYATGPSEREVRFSYLDQDVATGTSYYYVRVVQSDQQVAWGSPIWLTRQP